jgi:hypothetical protein
VTVTKPLEGLEGVSVNSDSVDAIPVCSRVVEQMEQSFSGSCQGGRALDLETRYVLTGPFQGDILPCNYPSRHARSSRILGMALRICCT